MHIGYLKKQIYMLTILLIKLIADLSGSIGLSMLATKSCSNKGSIWFHVYTLLHLVTNIHPPPSKTPGSICKPLNFYIG